MLAEDRIPPQRNKRTMRETEESAEEPQTFARPDATSSSASSSARRRRPAVSVVDTPPDNTVDADRSATYRRPPTSRRAKVTARPLNISDKTLVQQAIFIMESAPEIMDDPQPPAIIQQPLPPALQEERRAASGVTILNGDSTRRMAAMRILPPKRKTHRHWLSGLIILTLIGAVTATAIATVRPLATGTSEGLAVHAAGPLGLPVAIDAVNQAPTGQWVAVIGVQPNQDIGGGAGPGVSAPGSAGLAVKSVKSSIVTVAPNAAIAAGVSPPPLSPWPPSWAFVAVPGYYSFGMSDVNGYYNWAFGQCTWWAQYERQDENLMHMGNAQYWASVAASRGYSVGFTPQVGATVVFQPGIEGAGGAGHVAHVVKVYPDGWFLISEMNFYWNGGGWGRVDYRFAHTGSGVQFIY